ncbi:MAG TPA: GAF domain-containing protein, partial [Baekduia sp.]|nr:GAF domain-containing protein [Baekduia sp.]
ALAALAELLATRVAEMADHEDLARLLDEQAALRRVATLVARDVPAEELLAAVTREIGLLLGVDLAHLSRYEPDGTARGVASWSLRGNALPIPLVAVDDGECVPSQVWRTGRAAHRSGYEGVDGPIAERLRATGIRSTVGAPLLVDERLWGVLVVAVSDDARMPHDISGRIAEFAELVATAISNLETRAARARLADEQAALRQIATLVARDGDPGVVFAEVTATVGRLLGADFAGMARYDGDDAAIALANWAADGEHPPVARRWTLQPDNLAYRIRRTGRPARTDDFRDAHGALGTFVRDVMGSRSLVGCPIVVRDGLWGVLLVHSRDEHGFPPDTEQRLASFGELVATAVANGQAREEVARLADEQAALRRVATLVAHEAPAEDVLAAVGRELGGLMWDAPAQVVRFDDDGDATLLAGWGDAITPADERISLEGDSVSSLVKRSGRPARISAQQWSGPLGEHALRLGLRWAVGAPIVVDGRVWGAMTVVSREPEPFPADTEARVARFAELVGAAIANLEARERLAASRARVVVAADQERQRVVRDLHDGAQQRLVHTILTLKLALQGDGDGADRALVAEALDQAERATDELRALAHGILPEALVRGGLTSGVPTLVALAPVPVAVDVLEDRLPAPIEATAYFVIAEALTNVAKHARARRATVTARLDDGALRVEVTDDGIGGARSDGKGLVGLADRLAVHDGRLDVSTPAGGGTRVAAEIPLSDL